MPKTQRLTLADVRAITRLLGECRELGDDALLWRNHFLAESAKLVGADAAAGGEMHDCLSQRPKGAGASLWGFDGGLRVEGLQIVWEWAVTDPMRSELWREVHQRLLKQELGVTAARHQMIAAPAWDRSNDYQIVMRTMEAEEVIHSFQRLQGADGKASRDEYDGVVWFRARGGAPFSEREVTLIQLLHEEAARLCGGPLARWTEPSPSQLSPRARQVLHALLEGDTDKQIAARVTMSPHTVNQYTKQIFRHFGAAGRSQLQARWLRRGWSNAAAWDAPAPSPSVLIPRAS